MSTIKPVMQTVCCKISMQIFWGCATKNTILESVTLDLPIGVNTVYPEKLLYASAKPVNLNNILLIRYKVDETQSKTVYAPT